jgi:uncharacterized protein
MADLLNSVVIKIAARCNLNCGYCYIYNHEDQTWRDRPKFMSETVYLATLRAIRDYCARRPGHFMHIVFHGGEPLLIGKARFAAMCRQANEVLCKNSFSLSVQTNATLIDEEWAGVLIANNVHAGISMDGPPRIHDALRVTHSGNGSYTRVVRGLRVLQRAGVDPAVLCVVEPGADGLAIYSHFRDLGVRTMNFLLPDVSHDNVRRLYGDRGATPIADYLIPIFDRWFADDDADVRIRLFWGLLRMLMGGIGETDAFGNPPMSYVVVETEGSIEPLDALKVCEQGLTQVGLNILRHRFDDLEQGLPLMRELVDKGLPLPGRCRNCPEQKICGGGYYPNRYSRARSFDNPSVWCADILKLIAHLRAHIPKGGIGPGERHLSNANGSFVTNTRVRTRALGRDAITC